MYAFNLNAPSTNVMTIKIEYINGYIFVPEHVMYEYYKMKWMHCCFATMVFIIISIVKGYVCSK